MDIIFLHGFLGSHRDFQPLIDRLATINLTSQALDLPGHGKSLQLPDRTYTLAGAAEFVLDQIPPNLKPSLYGYSMGGRLALYLALHDPDRFSHVFLESSSPGLENEVDRAARRQQDAQLAKSLQQDFPAFLDRWYQAPLFQTLRQYPEFESMLDRRHQNNPAELAQSLHHMGTGSQPSLWHLLPQAQLPIHLIVGQQDPKFCALNDRMCSQCPTATIDRLPDCGHNAHLEQPDRVFQILCDRLDQSGT